MSLYTESIEPMFFRAVNDGDPNIINEFWGIIANVQNNWGLGKVSGQTSSKSTLLQNLDAAWTSKITTNRPNDWTNFQRFVDTMITYSDPIGNWEYDRYRQFYQDRANLYRRRQIEGEGIGVDFTIVDGVVGANYIFTMDFSGGPVTDPGWNEKYFIFAAGATKRTVVYFDTGGALLGNVQGHVQVNFPPAGGVTDTFISVAIPPGVTMDIVVATIDATLLPNIPTELAAVSHDPIAMTLTITSAVPGVFVDAGPIGTYNTMGFVINTIVNQPGVNQVEESVDCFWTKPDKRAAGIAGHYIVIYYGAGPGEGYTVWADDGIASAPAPVGGTALLPVSYDSEGSRAKVCNEFRDAIDGTGNFIVTPINGGFRFSPTVTGQGDLPDSADGAGGVEYSDPDVYASDGSVLATVANDAEFETESNTTRRDYEIAAGTEFTGYIKSIGVDGYFWLSKHNPIVGNLGYNKRGTSFVERAPNAKPLVPA